MNAFSFTTVPSLVVEYGAARRLGEVLRERYRTLTRLVLVTDRFINQSGLIAPAIDSLATHGWQTTVIDDVIADPPDHVVLDATARAKASGAEIIVGLGGGSSMDVAKLIAVLCASEQPLTAMYGVGNVTGPRLPLVLMPTTAGRDRAAREAMLLGATLAGQAFSNAPVAAVHALAYPLGGHFHVPHGLSNSLVLMHVLRFNASAAAPLYAELADVLGCQTAPGASAQEKAEAFVGAMETLVVETGVARTLREVGVTEDHLPMLASDAMKQQRLLINNPREMTEQYALDIYRAAL
ncbi:MAG: iron-containing alcohol dehydrogenase [Pseudomonadota bacterium]|nr:iron-containing alcohol dehydrogenase [Pseudomonadota bacterium]